MKKQMMAVLAFSAMMTLTQCLSRPSPQAVPARLRFLPEAPALPMETMLFP